MARLQAVMEQLKEYTKTLADHARVLMTKLRELEAAEQAYNEERAEAELRANVGEITEAEWESSSRKAQRELTKIKENQEVIAEELNQIREVLGVEEEDGDSPRRAAEFNEMEFLKSVVGPAAAAAKPVPEPRLATPGGSPVARPPTPATPAPAVSPVVPSPPPPQPTLRARDTPLRIVSQSPSDNALGVTEEEATEQPRNLKCAECGMMNYASEWYCERCGAELAAI